MKQSDKRAFNIPHNPTILLSGIERTSHELLLSSVCTIQYIYTHVRMCIQLFIQTHECCLFYRYPSSVISLDFPVGKQKHGCGWSIHKKKKRIIWLLVWQDRSMAMGPLAFNFPRGWIMIMWTLGIRTGIKWVLVSVLRFPAGTLFNLTRRRANVDGNFCWMWWWSLDLILIDEEIPSVYITSHSRI